jgi:hypothetical protein
LDSPFWARVKLVPALNASIKQQKKILWWEDIIKISTESFSRVISGVQWLKGRDGWGRKIGEIVSGRYPGI